jgi:hypothetical protein
LTLLLNDESEGSADAETASKLQFPSKEDSDPNFRRWKRPLSKTTEFFVSADVTLSAFYLHVTDIINRQGEGISVSSPKELSIRIFKPHHAETVDFPPFNPHMSVSVENPTEVVEAKSAWGSPNPPAAEPHESKDNSDTLTLGKIPLEDGTELFVFIPEVKPRSQPHKKGRPKHNHQHQHPTWSLPELECLYRQDVVRVCVIISRTSDSHTFELVLSVPSRTSLYELKFQALERLAKRNKTDFVLEDVEDTLVYRQPYGENLGAEEIHGGDKLSLKELGIGNGSDGSIYKLWLRHKHVAVAVEKEDDDIIVKFYSLIAGAGRSITEGDRPPASSDAVMSISVDRKKTTVKQLKERIVKELGLELSIPIGIDMYVHVYVYARICICMS